MFADHIQPRDAKFLVREMLKKFSFMLGFTWSISRNANQVKDDTHNFGMQPVNLIRRMPGWSMHVNKVKPCLDEVLSGESISSDVPWL